MEEGWVIRVIEGARNGAVKFSDGLSVMSDCLSEAKVGETYAVKYEKDDISAWGSVRRAVLLESAGSGSSS